MTVMASAIGHPRRPHSKKKHQRRYSIRWLMERWWPLIWGRFFLFFIYWPRTVVDCHQSSMDTSAVDHWAFHSISFGCYHVAITSANELFIGRRATTLGRWFRDDVACIAMDPSKSLTQTMNLWKTVAQFDSESFRGISGSTDGNQP